MSREKTEFRWFSITEYDKEAEYLRAMHMKGWKVDRVTIPGFYHFSACTPEDVVYQLDYNQEGISHRDEYVRMFSDCGWEYLFDFVGYSYFRKPASDVDGENSIFCDDESRLDMLRRIMKGRLLPLLIIFAVIIIPQIVSQISGTAAGDPVHTGLLILYLVLAAAYVLIFASIGLGYLKLKKKLNQ